SRPQPYQGCALPLSYCGTSMDESIFSKIHPEQTTIREDFTNLNQHLGIRQFPSKNFSLAHQKSIPG
ncbi:MAG: hypothetical protein OXF95_06475, partial [Rhodobacteraceae bacterium]|nr:hypothetical protein [Paracoccaceae bacterium]